MAFVFQWIGMGEELGWLYGTNINYGTFVFKERVL